MTWLTHPVYLCAHARLTKAFKGGRLRSFRSLKKIIFLCGGAGSESGRHQIRSYLHKNRKDCLPFYADNVWFLLSQQAHLSSLEMEDWLAGVSDIVILVVESPGAIAELGAFSSSPEMRQKLLAITDVQYSDDRSFIKTGPIRLLDAESTFRPCISARFRAISTCADQLEERLDRIKRSRNRNVNVVSSMKHLLFLICDLVAICGPTSSQGVCAIIEELLHPDKSLPVELLLSLAVAMDLVSQREVGTTRFFYQSPQQHHEKPYLRQKFFDISNLRADYLGSLCGIPSFAQTLAVINDG